MISGLVTAAKWEMIILLGGLIVAVLYKLLTGGRTGSTEPNLWFLND